MIASIWPLSSACFAALVSSKTATSVVGSIASSAASQRGGADLRAELGVLEVGQRA